jgi:hypothetical protein
VRTLIINYLLLTKTIKIMKKIILIAILIMGVFVMKSNAQVTGLIDEQNVTVTMDLQPVLQLNMNTSDQINFTFNQIPQYYAGEIQYAATILTVSSSIAWDLWAVGTSQTSEAGTANDWDLQMQYNSGVVNTNAQTTIPLSALELHQSPKDAYNFTAGDDYSSTFTVAPAPPYAVPGTPGNNCIFVSPTYAPYTAPALGDRYIMGDAGQMTAALLGGAPAGSYLATGAGSNYYITIDYRILPGLPAVFPLAGEGLVGAQTSDQISTVANPQYFAAPGVYTMDVKYILAEDQ